MKEKNNQPEIKIFGTSTKTLDNKELFNLVYAKIPAERRVKIDKFRFDKSKKLSLAASVLLIHALKEFGVKCEKLYFEYNEKEKPYIKDSEIYFNLSHSEEYAICAVSNKEVGCDVEKIDKYDEKLAKRFFNKAEYEDILAQNSNEAKKDLFYRYWTLKESFIKNIGTGLSVPLDSFRIKIADTITVNQNINDNKYFFKEFDNIEGYKCALCSLEDCVDVKLEIVDVGDMIK